MLSRGGSCPVPPLDGGVPVSSRSDGFGQGLRPWALRPADPGEYRRISPHVHGAQLVGLRLLALEWQRKPEAAAPGAVAELDEQRAPGPLGLGVDNAGRSAWRCHAG